MPNDVGANRIRPVQLRKSYLEKENHMPDPPPPTQNSKLITQNFIYISPHFDDVPLSCGGQMARQTGTGGSGVVVTVCSLPPPKMRRTLFAAAMEREWQAAGGGTVADIYRLRRAEEGRALMRLGADHIWLDQLDAIYRRHRYHSDATLFGDLDILDIAFTAPLIKAAIATIAAQHPAATLYFPLAVGHHVDHQLTHLAAYPLMQQGRRVVFYEDFPYAAVVGAVERRIAQLELKLQPTLVDISATIEAKADAIAEYRSQLDTLFGGEAAMRQQVRDYAALVAGGAGAAERYWQPQ